MYSQQELDDAVAAGAISAEAVAALRAHIETQRTIVITDEEQIEWEIIGVQEQLLLGRLDLDAAGLEQVEGVRGKASALLDGEAEAVGGKVGGRHKQ